MVFISRVGFGICRFYLAIPIAKMSANKKINLEIKSDALRILKNSSKSIFVFNKNIFFVRFDLSFALSEL